MYHNTAAIIDADGKIAGIYRKMHIPDDPAYYEKMSALLDEIIAARKANFAYLKERLQGVSEFLHRAASAR